jgi:hypothetical protein
MPKTQADSPFIRWEGQAPLKRPYTSPASLRTKRERAKQKHDALCLVNTREANVGLTYCHCVCTLCWDKLARQCICGLCRCKSAGIETHSAV